MISCLVVSKTHTYIIFLISVKHLKHKFTYDETSEYFDYYYFLCFNNNRSNSNIVVREIVVVLTIVEAEEEKEQ